MAVYALKRGDAYYIPYQTDSEFIYLRNLFPEVSGSKAIRIRKDDEDKEVVKIETRESEDGLEYIHPDQ